MTAPDVDLERIAEALLDDKHRRIAVLTRWGRQPHPLVLAPNRDLGRWWLVRNDDFLSANQGSYDRMIVTDPDRLRGFSDVLLVVLDAPRLRRPPLLVARIESVLAAIRVEQWVEVLP